LRRLRPTTPCSPSPYTTLFRSTEAQKEKYDQSPGRCTGDTINEPANQRTDQNPCDKLAGNLHSLRDRAGSRRSLLLGSWLLEHRSEEHTSELQSRENLVCRLLL